MDDSDHMNHNNFVWVPIDGVLDLHNFSPKDLKYLIPDYLEECIRENIFEVRIIHGKGIGNLRRSVHAILQKVPQVIEFNLAPGDAGGWGATLVKLKKK